MSEIDDAFYRHTVAQRDAAWREVETLRGELERWRLAYSSLHGRYIALVEAMGACPEEDTTPVRLTP